MSFEPVNLFFACDTRYLPLFGVALTSLKNNRNPQRRYRVYVLHTDVPEENQKEMEREFAAENFTLSFRNVSEEVDHFVDRLHTRDYYSRATYYRLLIPDLYPEMDKALYLDSDILLRADVAELYDTDLGDALAGAIPDGFVNFVPVLRRYVENRVGVPHEEPYFNAGVLLMNLDEMRKINFGSLFLSILGAVTFRVAQDQDYLNVICRGRVKFLPEKWNYMPFRPMAGEPSLVHFNLDSKPWQKDGILYGEEFWKCADSTPYAAALHAQKEAYTESDVARAAAQTNNLIATAVAESEAYAENEEIAARIAVLLPA